MIRNRRINFKFRLSDEEHRIARNLEHVRRQKRKRYQDKIIQILLPEFKKPIKLSFPVVKKISLVKHKIRARRERVVKINIPDYSESIENEYDKYFPKPKIKFNAFARFKSSIHRKNCKGGMIVCNICHWFFGSYLLIKKHKIEVHAY